MNNDSKGNERELTDEEIGQVSGGINGALKHCASCGAEYDYDDTKCPACGKSQYYMKECCKCYTYFDYFSSVCPKCHISNYYRVVTHYLGSTEHHGPH